MSDDESVIPKSWLKKRLTVEVAEAENTFDGVPFGGLADAWTDLKAKMVTGDEIWQFSSSPESWKHLAGRAGVALVRNGIVVDCIVMLMN